MQSLWTRRSMIVFFLVGFGVPWIGWTTRAVTGLEGAAGRALFYTGDFMTIAGFVATLVAAGVIGFRGLFRRCFLIQAPIGWALFAIFAPLAWNLFPILIWGATHGGIGSFNPGGLAPLLLPALLAITTGPLGEEAGWRGYLLPRMLKRYTPLAASLILGVIWSLWHYPLYYNSVFASPMSAIFFTIGTLCFSVQMTVLWGFTRASVFWAIIFHWMVNITPGAVLAVFPDIKAPDGAVEPLSSAFLIVFTIVVFVWVGRERLDRKLDDAMASVGDEAIDTDSVG